MIVQPFGEVFWGICKHGSLYSECEFEIEVFVTI